MFGGSRRHRPPTQPLTRETANPNAATAAASAFLRRETTPSLSSAAAAAALKARPATPTNVSQVQSKRVSRRSASVSSTGSRDRRSRDLHRSPSASSMTERTFRSPSPSPARRPAPQTQDVPPVPKIPHHEHTKADAKIPAHKRAASLQTQNFQTASQKMKNGQGSWFGAATAGDLSNIRRAAVADKRASADIRPSSPNSINFSYPRSLTDSPDPSNSTMVYDPNSRRMIPQVQLLMVDQIVRDASEKPVRKPKHEGSRSGTHLAKGTVGRLKGTAVEPTSPPAKAVQTTQSPTGTYMAVTQQSEDAKQTSQLEADPESNDEFEPETRQGRTPDLSREQTLAEQEPELDAEKLTQPNPAIESQARVTKPDGSVRNRPSVVHEAPELEKDQHDDVVTTMSVERPMDKVDAIPVKSTLPPQQAQETIHTPALVDQSRETVRRNRVHSESPARSPGRTTHFAPKTDQLLVRHEPPPRSLSPRKSALKYSSPRDASPSEDGSDASAAWSGMASREDSELSRKKSVRVSFDEGNTAVIGESVPTSDTDSPQVASPQSKKPWHSIMGRNKRDSITLDEEETMTPRPALPSFGSIRDKKVKEPEERPLVRPMERSASPLTSNSQSSAHDVAHSSDQVAGSVLAQDQASRNEANTSRYREPLPPVVTSVEGQDYISNSDLSSDEESETDTPLRTQVSTQSTYETQPTANYSSSPHENDSAKSSPSETIPTISIIQPSPRIPDEDQPESPQDFFDVPGGFTADTTRTSSNEAGMSDSSKAAPLESNVNQSAAGAETSAPIATRRSFDSTSAVSSSSQMHDIQEEPEESDGSSIYSDAYEDLSDMEGDGFLSLDAVVDSPVEPTFSQKVFEKAIVRSKEAAISQQKSPTEGAPGKSSHPPSDWETAKAYWRSLSPKDRRQLEREAMEDSDEEPAPQETVQRSKPKSKSKPKQKLVEDATQESLKEPQESPISDMLRDPTRVYQIQPGTTWPRDGVEKPCVKASTQDKPKSTGGAKLRKSMRGSAVATPEQSEPIQTGSMRKSMRSGAAPSNPQNSHSGTLRKSLRPEPEAATAALAEVVDGTGMRKSLRGNGSAANGQKMASTLRNGARPTSYQPAATSETVQTQRRTHSEDRGTTMRNAPKPALSRRGSDSSESSFRRAKTGGEGTGFRRTMRGTTREPATTPHPPESARASSRFSLRSLSPTGSAFRRNSNTSSPPPVAMSGRMRSSLRAEPSDAGSSRMLSGFGRSTKGKKSKGGSRFDDSSDEDDSRPAFRSRFVDSSDEDTPSPRPKQKRVPKTMRSTASNNAAAAAMSVPAPRAAVQDSPDLPDSDDEEEQPQQNITSNGTTNAAPRPTTAMMRNGSGRDSIGVLTGSAEPAGARPGHKRRGSFMSAILRRKKDPAGKISRTTSESASRRDTHLERGPERLAFIRSNSESQAHSSRLHKRGSNWPLQDHENAHEDEEQFDDGSQNTYVVDEEKRPSTAGGLGLTPSSPTTKAGFLKRRSTSHSQIGSSNVVAASVDGSEVGTPKKKKFGALRRMLKLDE